MKKEKQMGNETGELRHIVLNVNGVSHDLKIGSGPDKVEASHTLAHTLRETLGLTGTKVSCDNGACGACTILMNGKAVLSCMTLTVECHEKEIMTIEEAAAYLQIGVAV